MLLNKNNIDTCSSLKIGKDKNGNFLKTRIDKLTLVSFFMEKIEMKETYLKLKNIGKEKNENYSITHIKNKDNMPYRRALLIKRRNKKPTVLLRIDYSPINKNTGGIRFDFHPQHLTTKKFKHLLLWMKKKLGEVFYQLLARAWITQIDVALDLYGRRLHDYIWSLERAGKTMYYDTLKGLPGMQIGSKRSQIHLLCYEKIDAYGNKSQKFKDQSNFIKINPNNHKRFLRIESRYRPNAKPTSKDGRPMMLADLLTMKNPFERLQVYSKDMPHQFLGKGFIFEIPNEPSLGRLTQYILKDMQYSRLPRNIINEIKKYKIDLFDKNIFWYRWPLLVKKIGCILDIAQEYSSKE